MNAAFLPPPSRPPHDPLRLRLDHRAGWRTAVEPGLVSGVGAASDDGALQLVAAPGSGRLLAEPSGSFGGLTWPDHLAPLVDGRFALLDTATGQLRRWDECRCRFEPWPCLRSDDPRVPAHPGGIALACDQLLICDPEGQRVIVLHPQSGNVRAVWGSPPSPPLAQPWTPVDAVATGGRIVIADPANGGLHLLATRGNYRRFVGGLGAVRSLAADASGNVYVRRDGESTVAQVDLASGNIIATYRRPAEIAARFSRLPVAVRADGSVDLSRCCAGGADVVVDVHGDSIAVPPPDLAETYAPDGMWTSAPLDSEIAHCTWDRVDLCAIVPPGATIDIHALTSEQIVAPDVLASLAPEDWIVIGTWRTAPRETPARASRDWMLRCPRGRYLYLRIVLRGTGTETPRIAAIEIDFPRISLRRYLPQVFGADPIAAEFLDRWLAVFDHEFRAIESMIDHQAAWFDPLSAPTGDRRCDFLRFLADWVGVALEQSWPEARRRAFLKGFARVFPRRGTVAAIRETLYLFLGLERWSDYAPARAACEPCVTRARPAWRAPRLVLELYQWRRAMLLGHARLSDKALLWGERIAGRSRLSDPASGDTGGAQLGVTALDTSLDPERDIFHTYAHRLSIFVPASRVRTPAAAGALDRLIAAETPAHVAVKLIKVEPRFRIGVQSALGLDAVIGVRPRATTLDLDALGRATVLGGRVDHGPACRAGNARLGMQTIL